MIPSTQSLANRLTSLLEGGQVYEWDDLARQSGVPEAEIQWTCRRLHLDHNYSALSVERILEAFDFAERHNPRPGHNAPSRPLNGSAKGDPQGAHQHQHDKTTYGFMRSGIRA